MKLILGGAVVPLHAALGLRQTYEPIGGSVVLRMQSGAALKQRHWRKLRTSIQGDGWMPPGLVDLDYDGPLLLSCVKPRSIVTPATVATIPSARRSDAGYQPRGWALVGEQWIDTAVAMNVDEATLTPVVGASQYKVDYYPEFMVVTEGPQEEGDLGSASYRWTLVAEEV